MDWFVYERDLRYERVNRLYVWILMFSCEDIGAYQKSSIKSYVILGLSDTPRVNSWVTAAFGHWGNKFLREDSFEIICAFTFNWRQV